MPANIVTTRMLRDAVATACAEGLYPPHPDNTTCPVDAAAQQWHKSIGYARPVGNMVLARVIAIPAEEKPTIVLAPSAQDKINAREHLYGIILHPGTMPDVAAGYVIQFPPYGLQSVMGDSNYLVVPVSNITATWEPHELGV